jgi:hypothetical protein
MGWEGAAEGDSFPSIKNRAEPREIMVFFGPGERSFSRACGGGTELASSGLGGMVSMAIFMAKSNSARSMLFVLRIEFGKTGWGENFG